MNLAPIILFVYNRPWHTEQTLEALKKNVFAKESILYIYSDGPKDNASIEDVNKIKKVRSIIQREKWCGVVIIKERSENLGLAESVIKGVTEVIEKHGRIIVLEDDIVTGKYFLQFMNEGLNIYEDEQKVYGISGYCFPHTGKTKEATYFLPIMSSWGYGTWANRWKKINFSGVELHKMVEAKKLGEKLDYGDLQYYQMLLDQVAGKNDSWAIRFYVSMFLKNGLFLYPNISLLKNIGLDGSGVHCPPQSSENLLNFSNYNLNIPVVKKKIVGRKRIQDKFQINQKSNIKRIIKKKIRELLAPELIQLFRRKTNFSRVKSNPLLQLPRYTRTYFYLNGNRLIIPDNASFQFMYKEIFEQEIYKFETSNSEPFIIDGGANIGLASIYFKQKHPKSKIIAFEPDPSIFEILKNNIEVFDFTDIELIQKGLWDKFQNLTFWSEGADAGIITDLDNTRSSNIKIQTVSLKEYINRPVDLLKLDIEGAETVVLGDIEGDLVNVKRIFVEYHSFVDQPQTLSQIIGILTRAGFRLYISSPGLSSINPFTKINTYNNMDMQLNIFGFKDGIS